MYNTHLDTFFPAFNRVAGLGSTIDWYDPWPAEALTSVALRAYKETPAELGVQDLASNLSQMSSCIHISAAEAGDISSRVLTPRGGMPSSRGGGRYETGGAHASSWPAVELAERGLADGALPSADIELPMPLRERSRCCRLGAELLF